MNEQTAKMIRRYAKLRGAKMPVISYKVLKKVYKKASPETQLLYKREMRQYIYAVENKLIEPGDSYLYTVLSVPDKVDGESKSVTEANS